MKKQFERYLDKNIKNVGFLDIETQGNGFSANKAHLVSWVVEKLNLETNDMEIISDIIDKDEIKATHKLMLNKPKQRTIRPYDKRILENLVPVLKECDLIVTHYGTWFDIPMIRTRSKMQNIKFITHSDKIRFADTWRYSKNGFKIDRNTLDLFSKTLNVPQRKTKVEYFWWQMCMLGNKQALEYVLHHNKLDVTVTRKAWLKSEMDFPIPARYY